MEEEVKRGSIGWKARNHVSSRLTPSWKSARATRFFTSSSLLRGMDGVIGKWYHPSSLSMKLYAMKNSWFKWRTMIRYLVQFVAIIIVLSLLFLLFFHKMERFCEMKAWREICFIFLYVAKWYFGTFLDSFTLYSQKRINIPQISNY